MPSSLLIEVRNETTSSSAFAYVTGISLSGPTNGKRCLIQADGHSLHVPEEVSAIGSKLSVDCTIPLGAPGNVTSITIPQLAGGRLWISVGTPLTFLLNPGGPALVEPSVLNPSDPNANVDFGFMEFTLNNDQLYGNISYVDFVPRTPIAIELETASGDVQTVMGMRKDGIKDLARRLGEQTVSDGRPWDKLVVKGSDGQILRVLNATHGGAVGANFDGYFEEYVNRVWDKYKSTEMRVNTQAGAGVLTGRVAGDKLKIGDEEFGKPNSADILGCNSGPFTTGPSPIRNAIIPRLAAAFVRTTLIDNDDHPTVPETFYKGEVTNHYARIVHEVNIDLKGYAFAYDDVNPDGGEDQSGKVNAGDPKVLRITIGGRDGQNAAPPVPLSSKPAPEPAQPAVTQGQDQGVQAQHGFRNRMGGMLQKVLR